MYKERICCAARERLLPPIHEFDAPMKSVNPTAVPSSVVVIGA
jgi:hypothetical protein